MIQGVTVKQQPGKDRLTAGNWHVGISRQPGALPARLPPVTVIGDRREAGVFEQVEAHRTTSTVVDAGAVSTGASLLWITPGGTLTTS